jgi:hypothetical protein
MNVTCQQPNCHAEYDDAERSTLCPHNLIMSREDLDRKILAITLAGKKVRFNHQSDIEARNVQVITFDGWVAVEGVTGLFAPHLFTVVD